MQASYVPPPLLHRGIQAPSLCQSLMLEKLLMKTPFFVALGLGGWLIEATERAAVLGYAQEQGGLFFVLKRGVFEIGSYVGGGVFDKLDFVGDGAAFID